MNRGCGSRMTSAGILAAGAAVALAAPAMTSDVYTGSELGVLLPVAGILSLIAVGLYLETLGVEASLPLSAFFAITASYNSALGEDRVTVATIALYSLVQGFMVTVGRVPCGCPRKPWIPLVGWAGLVAETILIGGLGALTMSLFYAGAIEVVVRVTCKTWKASTLFA